MAWIYGNYRKKYYNTNYFRQLMVQRTDYKNNKYGVVAEVGRAAETIISQYDSYEEAASSLKNIMRFIELSETAVNIMSFKDKLVTRDWKGI